MLEIKTERESVTLGWTDLAQHILNDLDLFEKCAR